MRKYFIAIIFILLLFIFGCSKEEPLNDPTDVLTTYIEHWNKEHFQQMYDLLTEETTKLYQSKDFVDRYKHIYEEINMKELKVEFTELSQEEIENAIENKNATFQVDISMDSIAGDIQYSEQIELSLVEEDNEET